MRTRLSLRLLSTLGLLCVSLAPSGLWRRERRQRKEGEFSVQRFEPAPGTKNYLSASKASAWTAAMGFSAGLMFNYSRNPFVVRSCKSRDGLQRAERRAGHDVSTDTDVIKDMFTWDVLASLTPFPVAPDRPARPAHVRERQRHQPRDGRPCEGIR